MSRYPYLLLDADNTLFDFDAANHNAFAQVCDYCGLPYSEELYEFYADEEALEDLCLEIFYAPK